MLQPSLSRSKTAEQPIIRASALIYGYGGSGRGLFRRRAAVHYAVNDVSFEIYPGETLGLVGESGSGKTTIGRMVSATLRPHGGAVELLGAPFADPMPLQRRSRIQSVFQDSLGVLNPRLRIGRQLEEPMTIHGIDKAERRKRIASLLADVGLPERTLDRFPGEVSGGQRQRVLLARALVLRPDVLVCDEPVSALDVSIQAQVINLLADLKQHHALTMLFISHDLRVVRHLCDRIAVLFAGRIVEIGPAATVIGAPKHPYTRLLVDALPPDRPGERRRRSAASAPKPEAVTGSVGTGCAFAPRCPLAQPRCDQSVPELRTIQPRHDIACHLVDEP